MKFQPCGNRGQSSTALYCAKQEQVKRQMEISSRMRDYYGPQLVGTPRPVIQVSGIRKTYGATVAVSEVSFAINEGEIFGLIGPNGAGKTTTMECVEGVRRPDGGTISILGLDPFRDVYQLQNRIGVQLQQAKLQKRIKVWEAVDLWVSPYSRASAGNGLLDQLRPADKRKAWFMTLSGGQKQRLFIALALINDPEVVFLDELTTGLDPQSRRAGHGQRARRGTPARHPASGDTDAPGLPVHDSGQGRRLRHRGHPLSRREPDSRDGLSTVLPNLEDVFLKLTGHSIRD